MRRGPANAFTNGAECLLRLPFGHYLIILSGRKGKIEKRKSRRNRGGGEENERKCPSPFLPPASLLRGNGKEERRERKRTHPFGGNVAGSSESIDVVLKFRKGADSSLFVSWLKRLTRLLKLMGSNLVNVILKM